MKCTVDGESIAGTVVYLYRGFTAIWTSGGRLIMVRSGVVTLEPRDGYELVLVPCSALSDEAWDFKVDEIRDA